MDAAHTQRNLYLSLTTPLGKDVLLLHAFHGEEGLSEPFHFSLELHSEQGDVDFSQVVGKGAAVELALPDGSFRHFHGLVTRFIQAGTSSDYTRYFAELRPWLWTLSLGRDSRIFQNQAVPDILQAVFQEQGFTDFRLELKGRYEPREYCVQFQESDFAFVSRLMEEEGLFYFFEHTAQRHTLVLADDADAHAPCPGLKEARVEGHEPSPRPDAAILECELEQRVIPVGLTVGDFHFETPTTRLSAEVSAGGGPGPKLYEYPGHFTKRDEGERRARRGLEAVEAGEKVLRGKGRVRAFLPGYRFTLAGHPRGDVNGEYVLQRVSHAATLEQYGNSFEAFPSAVPFRPLALTPRPAVTGVQSARVVGKQGEDIWTDRYGRVKVRFHWDRLGRSDETGSCWIRVAHGWSGKGWGSFFLPHVGQEVLVTFVDGDPDRPIITGSVYNAEMGVPYALPAEQTKSTIRGCPSGEGSPNELRFEDKKGSEELYLHARKDLKETVEHDVVREVGHDATTTVKHARTTTIKEADDTLVVEKGHRVVRVEQGHETHEVKGDYTLKVQGNLTLEVKGDVVIESGKSLSSKAKMSLTSEAGTDLTNKAKMSLTNEAGTALLNKAKMSLTNEAGVSLENKAKAAQTVDGGGMLTIKGGLVKVN